MTLRLVRETDVLPPRAVDVLAPGRRARLITVASLAGAGLLVTGVGIGAVFGPEAASVMRLWSGSKSGLDGAVMIFNMAMSAVCLLVGVLVPLRGIERMQKALFDHEARAWRDIENFTQRINRTMGQS